MIDTIFQFIETHPSLIYAAQVMVAALLVFIHLPKRKYFALRFVAVWSVALTISAFLPDFIAMEIFYIPFFVILNIVGLTGPFLVSSKAQNSFFFIMYVFLMQHIAECLTNAIRYSFGLDSSSVFWNLISFLSYAVIYVVLTYVFVRECSEINIKATRIPLLLFLGYFLIFSIRNIAVYFLRTLSATAPLYAVVNVSCAITATLFLILAVSLNHNDTQEIENLQLVASIDKEKEHYQKVVSNIDVINRKCHDLKHQIKSLRRMNDEDREIEISKLEQDIMIYENFSKTGNIDLDNILSEKMLICNANKIKFTYMVDGNLMSFMSSGDIYILFGNCLDNAIECVMKYEEEKRIISMNISRFLNMTTIHLENFCSDDVQIDENQSVVTTKQDKNYHGYGLKSIRYIAEKYNGNMTISKESMLFQLDIIFLGE